MALMKLPAFAFFDDKTEVYQIDLCLRCLRHMEDRKVPTNYQYEEYLAIKIVPDNECWNCVDEEEK